MIEFHHFKSSPIFKMVYVNRIPAHAGPKRPVVATKLISYLKGQGNAKGQVCEGQMNHEYDGDRLGGGTEEQDPQGKGISNEVDSSDHRVHDRDGNAGVYICKQGKGGVVQVGVAAVSCHDWMEMVCCHLRGGNKGFILKR